MFAADPGRAPGGRGPGSGRILGVKLGFNPNSSSLGVDVSFLVFGLSAITVLTPVVAALLRLRSREAQKEGGSPHGVTE